MGFLLGWLGRFVGRDNAGMSSAHPEVLLFPYLFASERLSAGGWQIIPRADLVADDVSADWVRESTLGLLDLYAFRSGSWDAVGCIARPPKGVVGDPLRVDEMRVLHRAVVAALLDPNPSLSKKDAGHQVATSDNALVYGHRVDGSGSVWVDYGVMVRAVVGGLSIGSDDVQIAAPPEVLMPFLHPSMDQIYLDALVQVLGAGDDKSRRLSRAIDWLDLAWRNTSSIDEDTRIVALRAGFEVLFGVGDQTGSIRSALSELLDEESAARATRMWKTLQGATRNQEMTDLEWWFMRFAFLRNAIMHGSEPTDDDYMHDGNRHLWLAEETLRRAIKYLVANSTTSDVLMSPLERALNDAWEEIESHDSDESSLESE